MELSYAFSENFVDPFVFCSVGARKFFSDGMGKPATTKKAVKSQGWYWFMRI